MHNLSIILLLLQIILQNDGRRCENENESDLFHNVQLSGCEKREKHWELKKRKGQRQMMNLTLYKKSKHEKSIKMEMAQWQQMFPAERKVCSVEITFYVFDAKSCHYVQ